MARTARQSNAARVSEGEAYRDKAGTYLREASGVSGAGVRGIASARPGKAGKAAGARQTAAPSRSGSARQTATPSRSGNARQTAAPSRSGNARQTATPYRSGNARQAVAPARSGSAPTLQSHIVLMTAAEKIRMVATVALIGAVFLCVIFLTSYGASVQREINRVNAESAVIGEEIESLKLAIERGRNIATVEWRAINELGMTYPAGAQLKYLEELNGESVDLAQTIREKAYGA